MPTESAARWEPLTSLGETGGVYVDDACCFGADALLLADFAAPRGRDRVCDLGTGSGILPLLWQGRTKPCTVGVERRPETARLAAASVARNGLEARVRILEADWRRLGGLLPREGFDLVTCNPPYFPPGAGKASPDEGRRLARQEDSPRLLWELSAAAAGLLRFGGRFCLCHRPERLCDLLAALREAGLEPKRLRFVQATAASAPWLLLCEARKGGRPGLRIEPPLCEDSKTGET